MSTCSPRSQVGNVWWAMARQGHWRHDRRIPNVMGLGTRAVCVASVAVYVAGHTHCPSDMTSPLPPPP
jgi:hypothetical protein